MPEHHSLCDIAHGLMHLLPWTGGTQKKAVVALLTSLPFGVSAVAIILNARHSKATGLLNTLSAALPGHPAACFCSTGITLPAMQGSAACMWRYHWQ